MPNELTIIVPIEIKRQDIEDLIVSAIEGGIGYWCREIKKKDSEKWAGSYLGLTLTIVEAVDDNNPTDDEEHILDLTQINLTQVMEGLTTMAKISPGHFGDFIADNADAITADAFIQATLFGEIRYG